MLASVPAFQPPPLTGEPGALAKPLLTYRRTGPCPALDRAEHGRRYEVFGRVLELLDQG
jgi:hypothetical protein